MTKKTSHIRHAYGIMLTLLAHTLQAQSQSENWRRLNLNYTKEVWKRCTE
mgnify:CR=1 FL=1